MPLSFLGFVILCRRPAQSAARFQDSHGLNKAYSQLQSAVLKKGNATSSPDVRIVQPDAGYSQAKLGNRKRLFNFADQFSHEPFLRAGYGQALHGYGVRV